MEYFSLLPRKRWAFGGFIAHSQSRKEGIVIANPWTLEWKVYVMRNSQLCQ